MFDFTANEVIRAICFSMIFIGVGGFLCVFSVRERIRVRWPVLVLVILLNGLVYYGLRVISWAGILPYLAIAYFSYRRVVDVQPLKLLYMMMVVVTYLLFSNSIFYIFEGSAYTWDWSDMDTVLLGFATSAGPMAWFMRRKIWPALRSVQTEGIRWLWVVPTTFMAINVVVGSSYLQSILPLRMEWLYIVITNLLAIASACASFVIFDVLRKTQVLARYQSDMRLVDGQLSMQAKRFAEILEHVQEVRVLQHDMRHHLRILGHFMREGEQEKALAYLREYEAQMEEPASLQISANYVGDIIARRSHAQAQELGIELSIQCALPPECGVNDTDLCIVLGNLMENAINACTCQRSGRKYVTATARMREREILLTTENSCNEHELSEQEKAVLCEHKGSGQGIPSVMAVAKKYGGTAKFEKQGDVYRTSVIMYGRVKAPEQ